MFETSPSDPNETQKIEVEPPIDPLADTRENPALKPLFMRERNDARPEFVGLEDPREYQPKAPISEVTRPMKRITESTDGQVTMAEADAATQEIAVQAGQETEVPPTKTKEVMLAEKTHQVSSAIAKALQSPALTEWFAKGGSRVMLRDTTRYVGMGEGDGELNETFSFAAKDGDIYFHLRAGGQAGNLRYSGSGQFRLVDGVVQDPEGSKIEESHVFHRFVQEGVITPQMIEETVARFEGVRPLNNLSEVEQNAIKLLEDLEDRISADLKVRTALAAKSENRYHLAKLEVITEAQDVVENVKSGIESVKPILEKTEGKLFLDTGEAATPAQLIANLEKKVAETVESISRYETEIYLPNFLRETIVLPQLVLLDPTKSIYQLKPSLTPADVDYFKKHASPEQLRELDKTILNMEEAKGYKKLIDNASTTDELIGLLKKVAALNIYSLPTPVDKYSLTGPTLRDQIATLEEIARSTDRVRISRMIDTLPISFGIQRRIKIFQTREKNMDFSVPTTPASASNESETTPRVGWLQNVFQRAWGTKKAS